MLLLPKQLIEPAVSNAHVCAPPAAISDAVPPSEAVAAGVTAFDNALVPRRPLLNCPQHHATPRTEIAHECVLPISICATVKYEGTDET